MFKGRLILPVFMALVLALTAPLSQPKAQDENTLTLEQAYAKVIAHNPQVQIYTARISAAEGHRIQQSLRPNPEAVFEAENFAGDDPREGFDAAEYTLAVEQQIEIAGKRTKREQVAAHDKEQTKQEALAGIQSILAQTKASYMHFAIAQERLALARRRVALADRTHETVKRRISAAKSADIQHTKADIEVSSAEVEQRKAEKELEIARIMLANLMGKAVMDQSIKVDLSTLPAVPDEETLLQAVEQTPMSLIKQIAITRQEAALDLVRANRVPDPTVGFGVRRYSEDDGSAFLASLSIPLPVADRNQGAIAEAKANVLAARSDREAQRLTLKRKATELRQTLISAREEVLVYQDGLLPSAQKAYAQAEAGFDRGAFSFLDLLDAQRTLIDVQEKHLDALSGFYETKAQLDLLGGFYAPLAISALPTDKKE